MIIPERMETFLHALEPGNTAFLEMLEKEAKEDRVPIIRKDMQSLLKTLLAMNRPKRILEVGCAVGFSSILMAYYGGEDCRIETIENYKKRIPIAKENFRRANMEDRIVLHEGDALDILKQLQGPYDFIFMDAAKGQYIHFLEDVLRLMKPGAVLVSDNVLQDGDLIESHYIIARRNRTIYKRMREYLYRLKHDPQLETVILPLGDGVTVSVRK